MKILVEEWFDYLDGCASGEARDRVEAAIATDAPSRGIFEALQRSDEELRWEARRLHRAIELPPPAVDEACMKVLGRVRHRSSLAPARLAHVEELLTPWCGQRVAAGLVLAAVARTSEQSSDALWPAFVHQASAMTAALCGNAASRLLAEFGRSAA